MTIDIPSVDHEESDAADEIFDFCSPKQKDAVESYPGPPLLLIGGFNSGKTTAAILHMLALCQAFPGYKVAVLRKTFKDLSLTTRPSFDQWIDPKHTMQPTNEKVVTLKNGSSFIFHHLDSPQSATILKGLEINAAILDQAEQMNERTFTILMGRLGRWKGAKVPAHTLATHQGDWPWKNQSQQPVPPVSCMLTANPSEEGDPELHWLWQRFSSDSQMWHQKWNRLGYRQMVLPSTDNKFAGEQNLQLLLQQEEDYVRRFVYGEWVKSKGHLFRLSEDSIIDYDADLVRHMQTTMHLGRVLDHGDSAPTCCIWFAVDDAHNIFVWQEYYQVGTTEERDYIVSDHRSAIAALSGELSFRTNLADPSIFNKSRGVDGYNRRERRWTIADESSDRRIITDDNAIYWKPADHNEDLSRQRLRQYLREDDTHRHPFTGELGAPHLYFIRQDERTWPHGCYHSIREIRSAKLEVKAENDGKPIFGKDRDPSIPDHALDCVRYLVNARPLPSSQHTPDVQPVKAYARADGRVTVTVPPITEGAAPSRKRGQWKSRLGGGY